MLSSLTEPDKSLAKTVSRSRSIDRGDTKFSGYNTLMSSNLLLKFQSILSNRKKGIEERVNLRDMTPSCPNSFQSPPNSHAAAWRYVSTEIQSATWHSVTKVLKLPRLLDIYALTHSLLYPMLRKHLRKIGHILLHQVQKTDSEKVGPMFYYSWFSQKIWNSQSVIVLYSTTSL